MENARNPRSWKDILSKRGVDLHTRNAALESAKREFEKEKVGCVIRSLESAFGAKATEEEWNIRLQQVRNAKKLLDGAFDHPTAEERKLAIVQQIEAEEQNLKTLIPTIAKHNSPLGRAILQTDVSFRVLSGNEIKSSLQQQKTICLFDTFHIAHVQRTLRGEIISMSDHGEKVDVRNEGEYNAIIITPKPKPNQNI